MYNLPKKIFALLFSLVFLFPSSVNAQVVINEVLPDPLGDENQEEWVELYNNGSLEVDVAGYILRDASNHEIILDNSYIDGGITIVPSQGWIVIKRNGASFSLNNSGDEIITLISSPSAELVDTFSYNGSQSDKSWGRIPDGAQIEGDTLDKTPRRANQSRTPEPTQETTSTPTSTPTPTPTKTPTPTPKPTPTKTPTPKPNPSSSPDVLGDTSTDSSDLSVNDIRLGMITPTPTPLIESGKVGNIPPYSFFIAGGGVIFLGLAVYSFFTNRKTGYNNSDGQ
ncbi:MAG TPA: lamin tail domain-containing protein, partial [Patescibacteria group bacterium]|nr:lamin tail domain-containing protein [Patescibacteria group bacterium]